MKRKVVGFKISEKTTSLNKEMFVDSNGRIDYEKLINEVDCHGQRLYEESRFIGRI